MNARTVLGALALIVLALLTWELRWVLLVLFGAVVLAVALDVPMSALRRFTPLNRPAALATVLVALLLLGGLLGQQLLPELVDQVRQLGELLPRLLQRLGQLGGDISWWPNLERSLMTGSLLQRLQPLGGQLLGLAGGAASTTVQLLLMVLLAILLALDPRAHQRLVVAITPSFYRSDMQTLLARCRSALGGWLAGMTIAAVTVFLLTWAGLAALRIPLALLSALACGLLTFVPTIGPTAATLLPLSVALLVSPGAVLQVLILRLALQNLEAFVITPLLLSHTVNLLPTVALMAQLCLGVLLGLPGVLLALPLVVVLQVICQQVVVRDVMDRWA
ncbi:MAG: AI-2E family transporter [Synechococcaceae bacterium WB9_2_112]|jgi:predicted PurR-regulated permease PerM|nr:AI-2E family transporter [Synechococcaceae bacterium WB9_2_112]